MKQAVTDRVLALLRGDEGVRRHAYDDRTGKRVRAPEGRLTIGCGVNLDAGLDDYEIDWLERHRLHVQVERFRLDAATLAFPAGRALVLDELPDDAQVALGLMCFQLGAQGTLEFHNLLKYLAARLWTKAAAEARFSLWAHQTPKRAEEVAGLLRGLDADPF